MLRSVLLLLPLLGATHALKCYACISKAPIAGISLAADITHVLETFPSCEQFNKNDERFVQTCHDRDRGCLFVTDPTDPQNVVRSCFPLVRDECKDKACYCSTDLCNAAAAVWPPALLLAAALVLLLGQ